MKNSEILDAMHLLLRCNTFSPKRLKTLAAYDDYDPRTPLMQSLKSMYDACVEDDKLVHSNMRPYFPGTQIYITGAHDEDDNPERLELNMLEFAHILSKEPNDPYCVQEMASSFGQMICIAYKLEGFDEEALSDSLFSADPYTIRELEDDLAEIQSSGEFADITYDFIRAFQDALNYVKRNEHREVIRQSPTPIRDDCEFKMERAKRSSDYARYSLQTLGEILAMLYPVFVIIFAKRGYEFENFMNDLKLIEIIKMYIQDARETYGSFDSAKELLAKLEANPTVFYNPEDEPDPENTAESNAKLSDFQQDFPEIAQILYKDFYTE